MNLKSLLWRSLQIGTVVTVIANVVVLVQNPFAKPYVERTQAEARLKLDEVFGQSLSPEWVAAELDAAVDREDLDRTQMLLEIAAERRIPVPEDRIARARKFVERETELLVRAKRCAVCAADAAECRTPSMLLACNVPIELTPVGDAKTLAEAGANAVVGNPVDRIGVALAVVGIGATALTPLTGGSSLTIKAGATALRVARKMGALGKGITRVLSDASKAPFRWKKVGAFIETGKLDEITDAIRFRKLGHVANDLGTVWKHAGSADTIFLLKHVDTVDDAASLAGVSRIAGKSTRKKVAVLGLAKAARALVRVADLIWWSIGLLAALAGQLLALLSPLFLRLLRKALRPARE